MCIPYFRHHDANMIYRNDTQGNTPFHFACQRYNGVGDRDRFYDVIITFLHADADPSITNNVRETIAHNFALMLFAFCLCLIFI